jgi:spore coat polysaccharide biosynthesis protein SpsF
VLATSASVADDDLVEIATRLGVNVFRGSESDVLARFVGAAKTSHADNIIRICADNPFIDPGEIDRLVNYFIDCPCDYACNHQDRLGSGYADGFGAEILTYSLLKEIERSAIDTRHREHVTLYLWDKAKEYSIKTITAPADLAYPGLRFDVDEQSDLEYLEKLISNGVNIETPASEVVRIAKANIN